MSDFSATHLSSFCLTTHSIVVYKMPRRLLFISAVQQFLKMGTRLLAMSFRKMCFHCSEKADVLSKINFVGLTEDCLFFRCDGIFFNGNVLITGKKFPSYKNLRYSYLNASKYL